MAVTFRHKPKKLSQTRKILNVVLISVLIQNHFLNKLRSTSEVHQNTAFFDVMDCNATGKFVDSVIDRNQGA